MGISNQLSQQLEGIFNRWAKVRITDSEVRKLIQLALAPNKEVLHQGNAGENEAFSACFSSQCDAVLEYHDASPTQQSETAKGTVFGAYNAITGYFQNVKVYKSEEAKLKSLLYGGTAQEKTQRAFALCVDFAAKGSDALLLN